MRSVPRSVLLGSLLLLLLLLSLGAIAYYGATWTTNAFRGLPDYVGIPLVVGAIVILISARIVAIGMSHSRTIAAESRIRFQRYEAYAAIMQNWVQLLCSLPGSQRATRSDFASLELGLLLKASPDVIERYIDFKEAASDTQTTQMTIGSLSLVVLAMRRDLGLENGRLDEGSISSLLLTSKPLPPS